MAVLGNVGRVDERETAEVVAQGGYAYSSTRLRLAPGNRVKVWDVRGATPVLVDSLAVPGSVRSNDVAISDDGALLMAAWEANGNGGGVVLWSLADPAHPAQVARFESANTRNGVHGADFSRVNARLHAFLAINVLGGGTVPTQFVVLVLADPAHPVELTAVPFGDPFTHDLFSRDGVVFVCGWDAGLGIWDVGGGGQGGSPSAPVHLATIQTVGGHVHNAWWYYEPGGTKRYVFVGQEGPSDVPGHTAGAIHAVDVSDLTAPIEVAVYSITGAGPHNFVMDEARGILYSAFYEGGVRALDVRGDLSTCAAAERRSDGRCDLALIGRELGAQTFPGESVMIWGVSLAPPYLYSSDMNHGIWRLRAFGD